MTDTRPRCPVDIDLVDPDTFESGVPFEEFAAMREKAPVFWHPQPGTWGDGFWVVTRHADVVEVSRLPEVFSSYERGALLSVGGQDEEESLQMTRLLMLNMDPPEHSQLRNIVQRAFTPRTIRALEGRLQEFADDIVERALAKGEGDFVKDVAAELPLLAICELIGIPAEDRVKIFDLSNRLIGFDDPEFTTSIDDAHVASMEMYGYANELAEERKREPKDDIITKLLQAEVAGGNLTVTAIAVKIIAAALRKFPQFNASVDIAASEVVLKKFINIGIAVDTDRGLLVPVIRNADQKNIIQIAVELAQLSEKARNRKIALEEMQGGTFSISNLGGIGGTSFTPIVNQPEAAILGMSRSRTEPVWQDGQFVPRLMLPLSLSYDHRAIDGADGIRFLRWVAEALEQPFLLALNG